MDHQRCNRLHEKVRTSLQEHFPSAVSIAAFNPRKLAHRIIVPLLIPATGESAPTALYGEVIIPHEFCATGDESMLHRYLQLGNLADKVREGRAVQLHWDVQGKVWSGQSQVGLTRG